MIRLLSDRVSHQNLWDKDLQFATIGGQLVLSHSMN